jgi:D-alanyl-D-alanine carboxypeptidase
MEEIMEWNVVLSAVLQSLLEFLLPLLAVAVMSFLVARAREAWARAKGWNEPVTSLLEQAVRVAVMAAEQAGAAAIISDKRAYAFSIAQEWLNARGIKLDTELIYAAIEAAVWKEFNSPEAARAVK